MNRLVSVLLLALLLAFPARAAQVIHPMDTLEGLLVETGNPRVVQEGPDGQAVIRIEGTAAVGPTGRTDAAFAFRINLDHVDLASADLLKLEVDAARATMLLLALENFPEEGLEARWYVLDALRGLTGWQTRIVDLSRPEEVRPTDAAPGRRLRLSGSVKDTGRQIQGENRVIRLGAIRAVQQAVTVDWDQRTFTYAYENDALVYRYPVTLENRLDSPVTIQLRTEPFQAAHAHATVDPASMRLAPGDGRTVQVEIVLPAADRFQPLYAERFELWARAVGIEDSDVTIIRSSDPIHLPVVVPLSEESLAFPLLPSPEVLPSEVLHFDATLAAIHAGVANVDALIDDAKANGIYNYRDRRDNPQFRQTLVSSAYLFRLTGESAYLETARALLNALPDIWANQERQYREVPHPLISSGIIVRMDEGWHYTLGLGWRLVGTQRSPYYYGTRGNGMGGSMSAIFYAFDMLAPHLSVAERARFIDDFAIPAGIQSRNHYIGDGNQQATVNAVALYAGFAARNWPLVAFTTSSEHGLSSIIEWTFTDEGMHIRDGYQTYALRPIFFNTELLFHRGINVYETYFDRLQAAASWRGERSFEDQYFWRFVLSNRMGEERPLPAPTRLTAFVTEDNRVRLSWEGTSTGEAWFLIERQIGEGTFETVGRSPAGWPAFEDECEASSTYRVKAMNYRTGDSAYSTPLNVSCD